MQEQHKATTDFKLALCVFIIAVVALWHTLDFPMSGSYAGVENQWYVSPALFPLFLLASLTLLSSLLLIKNIRLKGHAQFLDFRAWIGDYAKQANRDRWFTIFALSAYIYIFIPNVDFYLSTCLFCLMLSTRFYLNIASIHPYMLTIGALSVVLIMVNGVFSLDDWSIISLNASSNEALILRNDLICLAAILAVLMCLFLPIAGGTTKKNLLPVAITSLLVPLIIVVVFQFGLQVPMPVEYGSAIQLMEWLIYDVLQMA